MPHSPGKGSGLDRSSFTYFEGIERFASHLPDVVQARNHVFVFLEVGSTQVELEELRESHPGESLHRFDVVLLEGNAKKVREFDVPDLPDDLSVLRLH